MTKREVIIISLLWENFRCAEMACVIHMGEYLEEEGWKIIGFQQEEKVIVERELPSCGLEFGEIRYQDGTGLIFKHIV